MHKPLNLLLIEDNPADARLVRELLAETQPQQFNLVHVEQLTDGLTFIDRQCFDVVLLDLSLPDAQGLEGLALLQSHNSNLAIVIISGLADEELAMAAVQQGAQDYLIKGRVSGELLTRSLRYALQRHRSEQKLAHLAQYDALTNLPNRSLFYERLSQALQRAQRNSRNMAVMMLDLDHFKDINDTLGHDAGDQLLQKFSERLARCIRKGDTVARLGGDEFTILLEEIMHRGDAALVAEKILTAMGEPFQLNKRELYVTSSIGIASFPHNGDDEHKLLKNADLALYSAKEKGRSNYQFYDPQLNAAVARRMEMITRLRVAVDRQEFEIHYQPQFQLSDGQITGLEALLRWSPREAEQVPPAEFIPLLEETGLVNPVGEWLIEQVCQQMRTWLDSGLPSVRVAVNLSARQLLQDRLSAHVASVLAANNLEPQCLQLEINEQDLMLGSAMVQQTLQRLRDIGVQLSIDHYGTGHSALRDLRSLPIQVIKLDKYFIDELNSQNNGRDMVAALISLAHSVGLKTVAVGVEQQDQRSFLQEHGCDEAQGYLYTKPLPAALCQPWLEKKPEQQAGRHIN